MPDRVPAGPSFFGAWQAAALISGAVQFTGCKFDPMAMGPLPFSLLFGLGGTALLFAGICTCVFFANRKKKKMAAEAEKKAIEEKKRMNEDVLAFIDDAKKKAGSGKTIEAAQGCEIELQRIAGNTKIWTLRKAQLAAAGAELYRQLGNIAGSQRMYGRALHYATTYMQNWMLDRNGDIQFEANGMPSDSDARKYATNIVDLLIEYGVDLTGLSDEQKLRLSTMVILSWLHLPDNRKLRAMALPYIENWVFGKDWTVAMAAEWRSDPYVLEGRLEGRIREIARLGDVRMDDADRFGEALDAAVREVEAPAPQASSPSASAAPAAVPANGNGASHDGKTSAGLAVERPQGDLRMARVFEELELDGERQREFDAFAPRTYSPEEVRALLAGSSILDETDADPESFNELMRLFNSKEFQFDCLRDGAISDADRRRIGAHLYRVSQERLAHGKRRTG